MIYNFEVGRKKRSDVEFISIHDLHNERTREFFKRAANEKKLENITEILLIHKSHKLIEIVYIVVEECSFIN